MKDKAVGNYAALSALGAILSLTGQATTAQVLEEVLVTATKREENLQKVPIAISAFSAKDIADAGLQRLQDVTFLVPNMSYRENISNRATNFTLRGISSGGGLGNDPALGVYIDEVYVARDSAFNADLLDIERVEVLKGPQGTLFGRNTVVGAMSVTTKKPGQEFDGMVVADFGNYNAQRLGAIVSGPLTDSVSGKISVVKNERDGFLDNSFGGTVNTVDYVTSRGQLLWTATEKLEFTLTADYREDDSDGNNLITQAIGETPTKNYLVSIPDSGYEDVEAAGLALRAVYDWNGYLITSITSFNTIDEDYLNDNDWSALDALLTRDVRENEQWSQELRIASPGGERLNWVAGIYLFEQTFDALQDVSNGPDTVYAAVGLGDLVGSGIPPSQFGLPDTIPIIATSTIEAESYAAYANVDYEISDTWSLTGGLRYSTDKKTLDYTQRSSPIAAAFGFVELDVQDDIDDGEWTPTMSINWQPQDDILVYAKYSRGYKAGGFNNSISSTGSAVSFDPETMDAYELGLKSTWLEQRLRLNAAIFRMEYKDKQESAFVTGIGFVQTNAGEASSEGFEAELTYALSNSWTIYGAAGYADAIYDDYVIDASTDNTGNRLMRAPEWTFNMGTEAVWSLGSAMEMRARLDYSYQDEFFTQAGNDPFFAADSQGLLNARLGIRSTSQSWEATLWGRNLTNDDNINTIDGASTFFFPTYHYSLIAPRTYGVELRYSF